MQRWLPLCLVLSSVWLGAKPGARPAGMAAYRANPDVPPAGSPGEVVDPATGRGRAVTALPPALTDAQATAFPTGSVLLSGGSLTSATTHWFDPVRRAFTPGPALTQPRQGHRALLLKDGRLLVLGGTEAPAAPEVLEPGAAAFQSLGGEVRFGLSAAAVALDDGRLFLVDGGSGQCFTWDGRKAMKLQGSLDRPRYGFELTLTKKGKVLITGGWPSEQRRKGRPAKVSTTPDLPVECFNPKWGTFSAWRELPRPRARHQATRLEDGRVCLWAGSGLDATHPCEAVEVLDPAKEHINLAGTLPLSGQGLPAWADGLYLAEQSGDVRQAKDPLALLNPAGPAGPAGPLKARLANQYLAPTLLPLKDGQLLVLGTPAWGPPMDRWDPRTRQCAVVGELRAGAQTLALTSDGKVLSLGPVVDLLDPRSGTLTPLGWREDLAALCATVRPAQPAPPAQPPFAAGEARKDYRVVPLDKTRALVLGGTPVGGGEPTGKVELWDQKRRTLTPMGAMKTRRAFPEGAPGQGALRLADGSVLIWGAGSL